MPEGIEALKRGVMPEGPRLIDPTYDYSQHRQYQSPLAEPQGILDPAPQEEKDLFSPDAAARREAAAQAMVATPSRPQPRIVSSERIAAVRASNGSAGRPLSVRLGESRFGAEARAERAANRAERRRNREARRQEREARRGTRVATAVLSTLGIVGTFGVAQAAVQTGEDPEAAPTYEESNLCDPMFENGPYAATADATFPRELHERPTNDLADTNAVIDYLFGEQGVARNSAATLGALSAVYTDMLGAGGVTDSFGNTDMEEAAARYENDPDAAADACRVLADKFENGGLNEDQIQGAYWQISIRERSRGDADTRPDIELVRVSVTARPGTVYVLTHEDVRNDGMAEGANEGQILLIDRVTGQFLVIDAFGAEIKEPRDQRDNDGASNRGPRNGGGGGNGNGKGAGNGHGGDTDGCNPGEGCGDGSQGGGNNGGACGQCGGGGGGGNGHPCICPPGTQPPTTQPPTTQPPVTTPPTTQPPTTVPPTTTPPTTSTVPPTHPTTVGPPPGANI